MTKCNVQFYPYMSMDVIFPNKTVSESQELVKEYKEFKKNHVGFIFMPFTRWLKSKNIEFQEYDGSEPDIIIDYETL